MFRFLPLSHLSFREFNRTVTAFKLTGLAGPAVLFGELLEPVLVGPAGIHFM